MPRKRFTVEQIIATLRAAEVANAKGTTVEEFCRAQQITQATLYRWRKEYGGIRMDQVKRMKEMEQELKRLRSAVADLTLDNQILKEVSKGNF